MAEWVSSVTIIVDELDEPVPVPKVVYIGPADYVVKQRKHMEPGLMGETFNEDARIDLKRNQADCQRRETLMHEILHAVIFMSGYAKVTALDQEAEERLVVMLSPWLTQFIRDNPDTLAYMTAE